MAHAVKLTNADAIAACVKDIMDKMQERGGLKDVYAVACGGSLSGCYPLFYLLRSEAKQWEKTAWWSVCPEPEQHRKQ